MTDVIFARVLHILAVVIWIGGVSMVSSVALPAIRATELGADKLRAFQAFERRFAWQARGAILITGLSGVYMVVKLGLWERFDSLEFW